MPQYTGRKSKKDMIEKRDDSKVMRSTATGQILDMMASQPRRKLMLDLDPEDNLHILRMITVMFDPVP
jgi:hypothetical protein